MLSNPVRKMTHKRHEPTIGLIHIGIIMIGLNTIGRPYMIGSEILKMAGPTVTLANCLSFLDLDLNIMTTNGNGEP